MMLEGDGASSITFSVLEGGGPGAGAVCVRRPAKSMNSVFVRKPPSLKLRKGGPAAGLIHGISTLHL